jgi:hypothetical protein
MRGRLLCAMGILWLASCTQDPLAEHNVYWGLSPFERPSGPLVRVLDTDSATPAKQGLLYTSMRDAEVAATYTDRAIARQDEPGETQEAMAEVIYAIEPAAAPPWDPGPWHDAGYGLVASWASHGYGLQRALDGMSAELAGVSEGGPLGAALRQHVPPALRCTENTQDRAAQVLALSRQSLGEGGGTAPVPRLEEIKELAEALNRGVPAPDEAGCGLREVERRLDEVVPADETG